MNMKTIIRHRGPGRWDWAVVDWIGATIATGRESLQHKAYKAAVKDRKELMKEDKPV